MARKKEVPVIDPVWAPIANPQEWIEKVRSEYPLTDRDNNVLPSISVAYMARNIDVEERKMECIAQRLDSEKWPSHINYPFVGNAFVYDMIDHEGDDPNPSPCDYIVAVYNGKVASVDKSAMFDLVILKKPSPEELEAQAKAKEEESKNEEGKRRRTRKKRDPEIEHEPIEKPKRKRGRPRKVKDA